MQLLSVILRADAYEVVHVQAFWSRTTPANSPSGSPLSSSASFLSSSLCYLCISPVVLYARGTAGSGLHRVGASTVVWRSEGANCLDLLCSDDVVPYCLKVADDMRLKVLHTCAQHVGSTRRRRGQALVAVEALAAAR